MKGDQPNQSNHLSHVPHQRKAIKSSEPRTALEETIKSSEPRNRIRGKQSNHLSHVPHQRKAIKSPEPQNRIRGKQLNHLSHKIASEESNQIT
eukprot:695604-Pelagomonas_calceolata.AAC.2